MRLWLILASVVVFAAGAAAGALASRWQTHGQGPHGGGPGFFSSDPFSSLVTSEDVYRELGLDESQIGTIKKLLDSNTNRVREIHESLSKLAGELRKDFYAALTPDQKTRFDEIVKEAAEKDVQRQASQDLAGIQEALPLTAEEESSLRPILLDSVRARRELWKEGRSPSNKKKWEEIGQDRDERIQKVLPPEKFAKYLEYKSRQRRGPPHRNPPPPEPH